MDDLGRAIDSNLTTIRWIIIGVGLAGAVIITRSIRLASRFENATVIPDQFFISQVSLHGRVKSVEPNGILRISHVPILQSPFRKGEIESVRVKLAAVGHTEKSISYLQSDLIGQPVFFQLLGREDPDIADCVVKFRKGGLAFANLNMYLVKTGRATAEANPTLVGIKKYDQLARRLRLIELHSHRTGFLSWLWSFLRKPTDGKN